MRLCPFCFEISGIYEAHLLGRYVLSALLVFTQVVPKDARKVTTIPAEEIW